MTFLMRETFFSQLDPQFIERWSPRAFSPDPVDPVLLETCLEAARWAPSCFNEQPWRFWLTHRGSEEGKAVLECLAPKNQEWAGSAPVLMGVFAKSQFTQTGKPNRWAEFDTGAAWMSLALQARKLGLVTHAMGGFDSDALLKLANLDPDAFSACCVVALGREGEKKDLPPDFQQKETPSERRDPKSFVIT